LGLEDQVLLPGYLTDGEVKSLYDGAFAYVFPSENEGFGIPILEAMGFGVRVIHSDQPALMEVAGGAGLAFASGVQADWTGKVIIWHRENERKSERIQAGTIRFKDFSAEKFITAFNEIMLRSPLAT